MSDIVKGVSDLLASLVEIIKGIFVTIFNVAEGSIKAVLGLFKNIFNMAEGIVGFIIGNIFILGTLAAVYFGYILYQQRQGNRPAPISKVATGKTK